MSSINDLASWEELVRTQQKREDIYPYLTKDNLESIEVRPIYAKAPRDVSPLPRVEESTVLVASYHEDLEQDVYSFILDNNVEGLLDKTLFVRSKELCEHILTDSNFVFPLYEIFDPQTQQLNEQLGKEFLAKGFERALCVDLSHLQNSGANIIQQLAYGLGKVKELVEVFGSESLSQILFRISIGQNYFFEIAKVRALKILFNQFAKEYQLKGVPYIFAEPSQRNKSNFDSENNLIRSALELSAAMVGGADALYSGDYQVLEGTALTQEIGFKQQLVLAYESLINVFEDAASGSFYVESVTLELCQKAWALFLEIESQGGYQAAFKLGRIQSDVYAAATLEQKWVEQGKIKLVGVNLYPEREKTQSIETLYNPLELRAVRLAQMFE